MNHEAIAALIEGGRAVLGIEFGSTRIKAVLIGEDFAPIASGDHTWENRLEDGIWTYHLDDVWAGVQDAFANLQKDVQQTYGVTLRKLAAFGVSGMMHGFLAFDENDRQLGQFRTWRNTMTGQAAAELTKLLGFNIPQRWSIAHLYQAMLRREPFVPAIRHLTTLAGYVHWQLCGEKCLGIGEASGMFPIDSNALDYDQTMLDKVDALAKEQGYPWQLREILPRVLCAGEDAGIMTEKGAMLLDPTGTLEAGALMAPPEGDAGTGMAATNSVAVRTGNVSAGTSTFAMVVLEKPLSRVYPEIDMVTTPAGKPTAMVHCNNCTSDINAWAGMLRGFAEAAGVSVSMGDIYTVLFTSALKGDRDCGGVVNLPLFSGEPVVGLDEGRPMLLRTPDARLTFANFARSLVAGAMTSLKIGMDILNAEQVQIDMLYGHGGYFKTPVAGQTILSAALKAPISVMETADEGGPWGMALLAAYRVNKQNGETLESFLSNRVFAESAGSTISAEPADAKGLDDFAVRFKQSLAAEKEAIRNLH